MAVIWLLDAHYYLQLNVRGLKIGDLSSMDYFQ